MRSKIRAEGRAIRHRRIRRRVRGTSARPRLTVFRSLRYIYAQLVDDDRGVTLAAAGSLAPEFRERLGTGGNVEAAKAMGELIARKARDLGVTQVVFDRGGYQYHGRVKALAAAARAQGLVF